MHGVPRLRGTFRLKAELHAGTPCGTDLWRKYMSEVKLEKWNDLFEKRIFAGLATLMPDGSPQVTPVWIDYDGKHIIVNTAEGRQKDKNLTREPRVSVMLVDTENPYRYLEVRGRVVERTNEGADAHINKMAKKYLGQDVYPFSQPGEVRVIFKIAPEKTNSLG